MGAVAAALAVGVVGAGVGAYGASQAGKGSGQSRSTGEISQMPIGAYQNQLKALSRQQLKNNQAYGDQMKSLYPQMAGLQRDAQRASMGEILSLYPRFAGAERKQTTVQRGQDLADLAAYGQGYKDQFGKLSSAYAGLDGIANEASSPSQLLYQLNDQALDMPNSELRAELERSALADLKLGGGLSAEQERNAAQSARGAWSSRGLAYSNPAVASEILSRDNASQAMQDRRRGFASNIWQIGSGEDQDNRGFGLNVQGLNDASRTNRMNTLLAASQAQLNPIQGALAPRTALNPYSMMTAFQAPGMTEYSSSLQGAPQVTGAANAIQPLYNYGSDVNNTNFNAAESRAMASANAYAAVGSGMMSSGSKIYASR